VDETILLLDGMTGGHQRLRCDLPPVCPQGGAGMAVTGEDVAIDLLEGQAINELLLTGPSVIDHG
jgi:hypothetical protein